MKKIYIFKRNPPPLPIPLVLGVLRTLSIQPQIPEISVGTSNGTDHFGLVRPEYSGPALKVVHFDRSGHFGRSDRNVSFHLKKLLSPVTLFCILLTRTITKRAVAWVGSVQPECTVPLSTWSFEILNRNFCWMESALRLGYRSGLGLLYKSVIVKVLRKMAVRRLPSPLAHASVTSTRSYYISLF